MTWHYLACPSSAESEDSISLWLPGSPQPPTVKSSPTLALCCSLEWPTERCELLLYGTMSERCAANHFHRSTWSTGASPARTSVRRALARAWMESEAGFSSSSCDLSMKFDRLTSSWKTSLGFASTPTEFSANWPRAGLMRGGYISRQTKWAHRTVANAGGALLPTPTASEAKGGGRNPDGRRGAKLSDLVGAKAHLWPTPVVGDSKSAGGRNKTAARTGRTHPGTSLTDAAGGKLNPTWVEWLMGYPLEWTVCADWAMPLSRSKRAQRSKSSLACEVRRDATE